MTKSGLLRANGFVTLDSLVEEQDCEAIIKALPKIQGAGSRNLLSNEWCRELAEKVKKKLLSTVPDLGGCSPLQCTLFDKSESNNWLVSWHQDRSVPVATNDIRVPSAGIRMKGGVEITQPNASVLQRVLAVRLHLDDNTVHNGPLRVLPGTHKLGILSPSEIAKLNREHAVTMIGGVGSVMVMRPLLVHASSKAVSPESRRVLHLLYA